MSDEKFPLGKPLLGADIERAFNDCVARAIERGEEGAQLEIEDKLLRESLSTAIKDELRAVFYGALS